MQQRVIEQARVLGHDPDERADGGLRQRAHVVAVYFVLLGWSVVLCVREGCVCYEIVIYMYSANNEDTAKTTKTHTQHAPVDEDAAAGGVVEAEEEPRAGGLARA